MAASTGRIFLGVLFLICFHGLVSGYSRNDLDRYDVMIARLEARLLENQRRLEELIEANDDGERHAIKLDYRMDEFYPDASCDQHHFQCGGDRPKCISSYYMCDGEAQCANGADEELLRCAPPAVGSAWQGFTVFNTCSKSIFRNPKMEILGTNGHTWFTRNSEVTVRFTYLSKLADETVAHVVTGVGFYYPAIMTLHLPDFHGEDHVNRIGNRILVSCQRDPVKYYLAQCKCWREALGNLRESPDTQPPCCHEVYTRLF